jgi:hypothetical protein
VESEQWPQSTLGTKHNLKKDNPHPQGKEREAPSLHAKLLIGCMEILFLLFLAATIFGLD